MRLGLPLRDIFPNVVCEPAHMKCVTGRPARALEFNAVFALILSDCP
jgi:hypothetical protein